MKEYIKPPQQESRVITSTPRTPHPVTSDSILQQLSLSLAQPAGPIPAFPNVLQRQQYTVTKQFPLNSYLKRPKDPQAWRTKQMDALRIQYPVPEDADSKLTALEDETRGPTFLESKKTLASDPLAINRLRENTPLFAEEDDNRRGPVFQKEKMELLNSTPPLPPDGIALRLQTLRTKYQVLSPKEEQIVRGRYRSEEKGKFTAARDASRGKDFDAAKTALTTQGNEISKGTLLMPELKRAKLQHLTSEQADPAQNERNGNMADDVKNFFTPEECGIIWTGGHLIKHAWGGLDNMMNVVVWDHANAEKEWSEKFEDPLENAFLTDEHVNAAQVEISMTKEDEILKPDPSQLTEDSSADDHVKKQNRYRLKKSETLRWDINRAVEKIPKEVSGTYTLNTDRGISEKETVINGGQTGYEYIEKAAPVKFALNISGIKVPEIESALNDDPQTSLQDTVKSHSDQKKKERSVTRIETMWKECKRLALDSPQFYQDIEETDPSEPDSIEKIKKKILEFLEEEFTKVTFDNIEGFLIKLSRPEFDFTGDIKSKAEKMATNLLSSNLRELLKSTQANQQSLEKLLAKISRLNITIPEDIMSQARKRESILLQQESKGTKKESGKKKPEKFQGKKTPLKTPPPEGIRNPESVSLQQEFDIIIRESEETKQQKLEEFLKKISGLKTVPSEDIMRKAREIESVLLQQELDIIVGESNETKQQNLETFLEKLSRPEMVFARAIKSKAETAELQLLEEELIRTTAGKSFDDFLEKLSRPEMVFAEDIKTEATKKKANYFQQELAGINTETNRTEKEKRLITFRNMLLNSNTAFTEKIISETETMLKDLFDEELESIKTDIEKLKKFISKVQGLKAFAFKEIISKATLVKVTTSPKKGTSQ